jgi:hypothetical protein
MLVAYKLLVTDNGRDAVSSSGKNVPDRWWVDDDGWVVNLLRRRLVRVPPDLCESLAVPQNIISFATKGAYRLAFKKANLRQGWIECYRPLGILMWSYVALSCVQSKSLYSTPMQNYSTDSITTSVS